MAESRQIPVAGNIRKRKENASEISFSDFSNPIFSIDDLTVATWLIQQGLLGRSKQCERPGCDGDVRVHPWDTPSDVIEAGTTRFPS
jgi:hypothetical protein